MEAQYTSSPKKSSRTLRSKTPQHGTFFICTLHRPALCMSPFCLAPAQQSRLVSYQTLGRDCMGPFVLNRSSSGYPRIADRTVSFAGHSSRLDEERAPQVSLQFETGHAAFKALWQGFRVFLPALLIHHTNFSSATGFRSFHLYPKRLKTLHKQFSRRWPPVSV